MPVHREARTRPLPALLALGGALLLALAAAPGLAAAWRGTGHVSGQVRDPDGRPIAGARVTLRAADGDGPPPLTTDAKGRWSVGGLAGGSWRLAVDAPGFIAAEGTIAVADEGPSPAADVQLRSLAEETPGGAENPQAVLLWLQKGNTLLAQGHAAEARAEYEKALAVPYAMLPREQRPDIYQAVARTWFLEGNSERAAAAVEDGLRLAPHDATLRSLLHMLREDQGRARDGDAFLAALDTPAAAGAQQGAESEAEDADLPPEIRADLAAQAEAPQANRPGAYKVAFTESAPLSRLEELLRRAGVAHAEAKQQDPHVDDYDVRRETFQVRVPAGEAPAAGWGLLVWISPGPYGGAFRAETRAVLARHHLLWIGANDAGNPRPRWDRARLAIDAAWNVQRLYRVDPTRVYVGGYSGGSRMTSALLLLYPDLFRGGYMQMGVDWYHDIPIPDRPGSHWPAWFHRPPRDLLALSRQRTRFVVVEGERDFNLVQSRLTVEALRRDGFEKVTFLEVPGATHATPMPAEWLEKAFAALDGG